jgi:hypothetical protein
MAEVSREHRRSPARLPQTIVVADEVDRGPER